MDNFREINDDLKLYGAVREPENIEKLIASQKKIEKKWYVFHL